MNPLTINELGEVIRKVRKERGLRLNDLADENISQATISNIERGVPHVHSDKVQYLLEKLEIQDKLPELLMGEQQELQDIQFRLLTVESQIKVEQYEQALKQLEELALDDDHPYAAEVTYWKGRIFFEQGKLKRAERTLYQAIRLAGLSPYGNKSNVEALSFNELSICSFFQNNMEEALRFANSGLDAFEKTGENQEIKHILIRNKALYLERMDRLTEGLKVVQDHWHLLSQMKQAGNVLGFYWVRAEMLRRSGLWEEAEKYAREGLKLAQLNFNYDSMFDQWTLLGSIYMATKEWNKSEACFNVAASIRVKLTFKRKVAMTYTRLGILYLRQEKWKKAKEFLEKAIKYAEKHNDSANLIDALLASGDLYLAQDKAKDAIPYLQHAAKLARKHKYKQKEYKAWFRLARAWKETDEQEFIICTRNMYEVQEELEPKEAENLKGLGKVFLMFTLLYWACMGQHRLLPSLRQSLLTNFLGGFNS